jgi:trans-2,3-dihydro-3-hydroxyanthranilate isomerase
MPTAGCLSDDSRSFVTCDVFTDTPYAGNPLAIVEDASGLSDRAMQTIAREFNLSETVFVFPPRDPANRARLRIFFPAGEIPFAGHPTIGCALHLATRDQPQGDFDRAIVLEEEAGRVPVQVSRRGDVLRAELRAPVLPHAATQGRCPERAVLAEALGLADNDIGFRGHAPGVREGGPRFLFVPVDRLEALAAAHPREPAWSTCMEVAQVDSAYVYAPGQSCDVQTRMFSPTAGIPEDPATGSAAALLAAQLLSAGALPDGESRLTLRQGVEMGRPSEIGLRVTCTGGALAAVHVSGSAVPVSAGTLRPPAF